MAAVGGARERPVGTRVGVVAAASSDVIRLLPAKTRFVKFSMREKVGRGARAARGQL